MSMSGTRSVSANHSGHHRRAMRGDTYRIIEVIQDGHPRQDLTEHLERQHDSASCHESMGSMLTYILDVDFSVPIEVSTLLDDIHQASGQSDGCRSMSVFRLFDGSLDLQYQRQGLMLDDAGHDPVRGTLNSWCGALVNKHGELH